MSLDALRGFDMLWIVGAGGLMHALRKFSDAGPTRFLADQLEHRAWAGFAFYDLIFPLFIFIVGVSLTFSLGRLMAQHGRTAALGRVARRTLLLYALGVFYYGGFATPFEQIRLLGVLQRIALCYFFAGLAYCYLSHRGQVALCATLLVGYWALMSFVPVPGFGAGDFAEGKNLANWIDKEFLPLRKWDGDHDPEGLLSTLPAIAHCLLGVFAGRTLQRADLTEARKLMWLGGGGVALVVAGWLWHLQFPVIKKIWTSSFVLVSCGYSSLLLALFYGLIDVCGWRRWATPFVWIGMNPITIYLTHQLVDLKAIAGRFVGGDIHAALGRGGDLAVALGVILLTFWLSRFLFRRKIFLRL